MSILFTKMQSLGNDFIILDQIQYPANLSALDFAMMADRKRGIGCDQILVLDRSPAEPHAFQLKIYNQDGSEVEQCGNGLRCIGSYLYTTRLSDHLENQITTRAGTFTTCVDDEKKVRVNLNKPNILNTHTNALEFRGTRYEYLSISMGNPHAVCFVEDLKNIPLAELGVAFQHLDQFPSGVNVECVKIKNLDHIIMRVYERGVGETLACGSGACAAVVAGQITQQLNHTVKVELPGGELSVTRAEDGSVWLSGEVHEVFLGEMVIAANEHR